MDSKGMAIGGAVAATTVAVGVGVGASQSSSGNSEVRTNASGDIPVKIEPPKPPTNKNKLVNFKFNETTEDCKEWLEQEFKTVDNDFKQKVLNCLESKEYEKIAGYFKLKVIGLDKDYLRSNKWNANKQAEILRILGSPSGINVGDDFAQVNWNLKNYCTTENKKEIDISFSDDKWVDYLTVCVEEGSSLKTALTKQFWINENKEPTK